MGLDERSRPNSAVDTWTQMKRQKKIIKITADVEQKDRRQFKKRYTCDKNKMTVLEVNLDENKNV